MRYFLLSIPYWVMAVFTLIAYQEIPLLMLFYGLFPKLLLYFLALTLSIIFIVGIGVAIIRRSSLGYVTNILLGIALTLSLLLPQYLARGYITCSIGCEIPGLLTGSAFLIGITIPFQWYIYRKEKRSIMKVRARREALLVGLAIVVISLVAYGLFS